MPARTMEAVPEGAHAEAEALMEERRQHIATYGIVTRTVNQAYFAFYGSAWTHLAGERCGNAHEPTT